jgi:hypothetical protein
MDGRQRQRQRFDLRTVCEVGETVRYLLGLKLASPSSLLPLPAMQLSQQEPVLHYGISNDVIYGAIVFLIVLYVLYHVNSDFSSLPHPSIEEFQLTGRS